MVEYTIRLSSLSSTNNTILPELLIQHPRTAIAKLTFRANFLPFPEPGSYVQFSQPAQTGLVQPQGATSRIDSSAQTGWSAQGDCSRLEQHWAAYGRDRSWSNPGSDGRAPLGARERRRDAPSHRACLLYTSDAADDLLC